MIIAAKVDFCDIMQEKYDPPVDGGHIIAQGRTGRWCHVLNIGPKALAEQKGYSKPITIEEAEDRILVKGGYLDY